jgi:hypothetical protein
MAFGKVSKRVLFDAILANNNLSVAPDVGGGNTIFVEPVPPPAEHMVAADLIDEDRPWRHDSQKLAQAIINLAGPAQSQTSGL